LCKISFIENCECVVIKVTKNVFFCFLFLSVEVLRHLCQHVERETSPHIQNSLEIFLQQLVSDLKRCQEEQRNLEEALKLRDDEHQAEVSK
jgi:hypothetical protein